MMCCEPTFGIGLVACDLVCDLVQRFKNNLPAIRNKKRGGGGGGGSDTVLASSIIYVIVY